MKGGKKRVIPPLKLESLVLPFYTQALVAMGYLSESEEGSKELDLELAARLIDLIDLLKEKTKGNLSEEEEKFLNTISTELKIIYYRVTGRGDEEKA